MLLIDGDQLEGGGQILRTALALSVITLRPVRIFNIRKRRPIPGLSAQHKAVVDLLADLSNAKVKGSLIGSGEIEFVPDRFKTSSKVLEINPGTSASIGLILQPLLLVVAFSKSSVSARITGGTSGLGAMPVEYYQLVMLPTLKLAGLKARIDIIRYGFYPKGGGEVSIDIKAPKVLKRIEFKRTGALRQIAGLSVASKELAERDVAQRSAGAAVKSLSRLSCPVNIKSIYVDTLSVGSQLTLAAYTSAVILGADVRGEKGKLAENVGYQAAGCLIDELGSGSALDVHMADNIIPWLALAGGSVLISGKSQHTLTNIWVCEQFFGKIFSHEDGVLSAEGYFYKQRQ